MNTFLHLTILNIYKECLESESKELMEPFLYKSHVPDFILKAYAEPCYYKE